MDVTESSSEIKCTCSQLSSDQTTVLATSSVSTLVNSQKYDTAKRNGDDLAYLSRDTGLQTQHDITDSEKEHAVILSSVSTLQVCQQVEIVTEKQSSTRSTKQQRTETQTTRQSFSNHTADQSNESTLPKIDAVWSIGQEHSYEQRPWKCKTKDSFPQSSYGQVELDTDRISEAEQGPPSVNTHHQTTLPHSHDAEEETGVPCVVHISPVLDVKTKPSKRYVLQNKRDSTDNHATYIKVKEAATRASNKQSYRTLKVVKLPILPRIQPSGSWSNCLIDHNLKPLQIQHNLMQGKTKHPLALDLTPDTVDVQYQHYPRNHHFSVSTDPCLFSPLGLSDQSENLTIPKCYESDEDKVGADAVYMDIAQSPGFHSPLDPTGDILQDSATSLSMQQYLPDFSDLPQFHNIPPDSPDDQCTEPTQLIPSIDHSVLDSGWSPADHWSSYSDITASAEHTFSGTSAMGTGSIVPPSATSPATEDMNNMQRIQADRRGGTVDAETDVLSKCSVSPSASQATSEAGTATAPAIVKSEVPWPTPRDKGHGHCSSYTSEPMALSSNPDHTITSAVMTALDMDSNPSPLVPSHTDAPGQLEPQPFPYPYQDSGNAAMGCSSTFLSPPPSVEQLPSQSSTSSRDESGYLTMEEQDWQSCGNMMWPQHQSFSTSFSSTTDSYTHHHPAPVNNPADYGSGEGGGYPYTHQDSHFQTLHQTASSSLTNPSNSGNNSDIIYYPFNDLMQLNPSLLSEDMSVQYVAPHHYGQANTAQSSGPEKRIDPSLLQPCTSQKRGRAGRGRGSRQGHGSQIQSDHVTSSHHRQLQAQVEAVPKRQYKRRNPEGRKKTPRAAQNTSDSGEKKGRHNEPLRQKAVDIMIEWYQQHEENPYPSKEEKEHMALEGGITTMQVKSWFANKRNRSNNTRPKVQKRAMEEKLMHIYNQLSKTEGSSVQDGGNSIIIKELSQIIHNKLDPEIPGTPESAT